MATVPTAADWRSETGTFRIGVVARPDRGGTAIDYKPAAAAISDKIGMPVEFVPFLNYPALIEAQAASRIEYGIYSATAYGTASALCECLTPLAAPVSEDGIGAIVALALTTNDAVAGTDDIPAGKLAWVAATGSAPDVITTMEFTVGGAAVKGDEPYAVEVASPTAAVAALQSGDADTMLGWAFADADGKPIENSGTLAALSAAGIGYRVIWTSKPLRFGPHAARKDVPADIRAALADFLTAKLSGLPEVSELMDESFHGRFEPVAQSDYATTVRYAERLRAR